MALDQVLPREQAELARHPIVTDTVRNMVARFRRETGQHPTHLRLGTVLHAHLAREIMETYGPGLVSKRGRVCVFDGMDVLEDEHLDRTDRLECYADLEGHAC